MPFSKFEQDVMEMEIERSPLRDQLLAQFRAASVKQRDYSGFGLFVHFEFPGAVEPIKEPRNFDFGSVAIELDGLEDGAGVVVFVRDGLLDMLEIFTYDEAWPEVMGRYKLSYWK
jgi:hypothetical protein